MKKNTALTWDLSVLYKDLSDPAIEKDQQAADEGVDAFAKRYQDSVEWLEKPDALLTALNEYEKLSLSPAVRN